MILLSSRWDWLRLAFVQQARRNDTTLDVAAAVRRAREMLEECGASVRPDVATGRVAFEGMAPRFGVVAFGRIGSGELQIERGTDTITATADAPILHAVVLTAAAVVFYLIRHVPLLLITLPLAVTAWGLWLNYVRAVRRLVQATLSLNNPDSDLEEAL